VNTSRSSLSLPRAFTSANLSGTRPAPVADAAAGRYRRRVAADSRVWTPVRSHSRIVPASSTRTWAARLAAVCPVARAVNSTYCRWRDRSVRLIFNSIMVDISLSHSGLNLFEFHIFHSDIISWFHRDVSWISLKCTWISQRCYILIGSEVIISVPQKKKKNRKFPHGNFHSMRKNSQPFRLHNLLSLNGMYPILTFYVYNRPIGQQSAIIISDLQHAFNKSKWSRLPINHQYLIQYWHQSNFNNYYYWKKACFTKDQPQQQQQQQCQQRL